MSSDRPGTGRMLLYWSLQAISWGGYFSVAAVEMYAVSKRLVVLAVWLVIMLGHLAGSHALRLIMRRNRWLSLPGPKLTARLLPTVALLAMAVDLCVSPAAIAAGIATYREQASMYWYYVLASFILLSLWSFCYIAFVRYRAKSWQSLQLEASLQEAELRALKSQVNPHFLFNCLNNVRSLVAEDSEKAREMLLRLSGLLRYSLEAGREEKVTLDQELSIVRAYLELEKLHFESRLSWAIEADDEAMRALVPPMLVQQLVENAIKHGISKQPGDGEVLIRARMHSGRLEVKVENTGRLVEPLSPGFGIANARERLQLLCGANSTLRLEDIAKGRVAATAEIPSHA